MISVVIPSRSEPFLSKTIKDILSKAKTEIEVIAVLDGYWEEPEDIVEDDRVHYLHRGTAMGMRNGIRSGVTIARGDYILKCDAHCMFDDGFDYKLLADMKDNWVIVPTRKRLDPDKWEIISDGRRDVNYMVLDSENRGRIDEKLNNDVSLDSEKIVEISAFQGSCFFIRKSYFEKLNLEDDENFGGSGHEAQEIYFKVKGDGGKIIRDKNTWYAHWHKDDRGFVLDKREVDKSRKYLVKMLEDKPSVSKTEFILNKFGKDGSKNPTLLDGVGRIGMYKLFAELGYKVGCEVGVQRGRNAKMMFDTIPDLQLFLVDPYKDHPFGYRSWDKYHEKYKRQTVERLKDNRVVQYVFDYSENAYKDIPDRSLDFVYIDGDHSYDFVMLDIIFWLRKVKVGGIISGHDYFTENRRQSQIAKVTAAVDDYARIHKIPFFVTDFYKNIPNYVDGDQYSSWFWVNENVPSFNMGKHKVGIVQYTDNHGDPVLLEKCRQQIVKCAKENGIEDIVCVSQKPVENFGRNIVLDLERSVLSLYKQVLKGLEEVDADVVYLCEHDIVYHPSHFKFMPTEEGIFYYDYNRWSVCDETGKAVFYYTDVPSMMCGLKSTLIDHYSRCVAMVEKEGWRSRYGYSPPKGLPRNKRKGKRLTYFADFPSLDIRRKDAWTKKRMDKKQFRSERGRVGWTESGSVPYWGQLEGNFKEFIDGL